MATFLDYEPVSDMKLNSAGLMSPVVPVKDMRKVLISVPTYHYSSCKRVV